MENPVPQAEALPGTRSLRVPPRGACADCGTVFAGNYCPHCGQEALIETPTVRQFVGEFADQYIALEGKLGRTLRALVTRPGQLTLDYLEGRRQRYVRPLKLYLTISVLFFGLIGWLPDSMNSPLALDSTSEKQAVFQLDDDRKAEAGKDATSAENADLGDHIGKAISGKLEGKLRGLSELSPEQQHKLLRDQLADKAPYAMFFLLPYFALLLKIIYRKSGMLYGGHLLFSLHLHSFAFIALSLGFLPLPEMIRTRLYWLLLVYLFFALHRVYGGSWKRTVWRIGLIYVFYVVALTTTAVSGVLATVMGSSSS